MSRSRIPKLMHHKASGKAVVCLGGVDHYLGSWGTKIARAEYDRLVAEWLAGGRQTPKPSINLTVVEVMARYLDYADGYYVGPDGRPTTEPTAIRYALKPVRRLYGHTAAALFGPLCLKAVQQEMIKMGWCRKHINQKINIVRRMFKWATEYQLVPGNTYHALQSVSPLRIGRSDAPESKAVKPVPSAMVDATLPHVSRQVAAMIKLQRLSGMRPGEAVIMRGVDVDTSGTLWIYRPSRHKNLHRGHERIVYLGPQAQQIVREFLKPDLSQFLFSPADGEMERRLALHAARTTRLVFGNRPGTNKKRKPQKVPGERYTVMTYARAIRDACEAASPLPVPLARLRVPRADKKKGLRWESVAEWRCRLGEQRWAERRAWQREHHWHPHQLRHSTATQLRKEFGLEAAQVILGHKTLTATQLYAEQNVASAMLIMQKVG